MPSSVDTFIANLEVVLSALGWSNRKLAQKSGVSDRVIGMYRNKESVPSLDKAERLAKALGYELWQLQIPGFRPDIVKGGGFDRLYHAYLDTDDDGRKVMETTADYVTTHKRSPGNDPEKGNGGASASG